MAPSSKSPLTPWSPDDIIVWLHWVQQQPVLRDQKFPTNQSQVSVVFYVSVGISTSSNECKSLFGVPLKIFEILDGTEQFPSNDRLRVEVGIYINSWEGTNPITTMESFVRWKPWTTNLLAEILSCFFFQVVSAFVVNKKTWNSPTCACKFNTMKQQINATSIQREMACNFKVSLMILAILWWGKVSTFSASPAPERSLPFLGCPLSSGECFFEEGRVFIYLSL